MLLTSVPSVSGMRGVVLGCVCVCVCVCVYKSKCFRNGRKRGGSISISAENEQRRGVFSSVLTLYLRILNAHNLLSSENKRFSIIQSKLGPQPILPNRNFQAMNTEISASKLLKTELGIFSHGIKSHTVDFLKLFFGSC